MSIVSPVRSVSAGAPPLAVARPSEAPRRAGHVRLRATLPLVLGAVLLLACDGGPEVEGSAPLAAGAVTATPTETASVTETAPSADTATAETPTSTVQPSEDARSEGDNAERSAPQAAAPLTPDAESAMVHLRYLVETIGPRAAGSEGEREAAAYIAGVLRDAGYEAQVDEFEFEIGVDESAVEVGEASLRAYAMQGSPNAEVRGIAVFAGLGTPEDLAGSEIEGYVVIFDRGIVTFRDKVNAAVAAGAAAVVIVNDETGHFRGSLGGLSSEIPVVAVSGEDRAVLEAAIGERVTVRADARLDRQVSQNVVASVDGAPCRGYLGAHYDSVPQGPGANDNASGTAVILELARTNLRPGLCVVAFGAEEVGLFGSQNYVREHLAGTARFMLNVDMAGRLDGPIVVGDSALIEAVLDAIKDASVASVLRAGTFPPFASSDHVSFSAVGVPAVTFNSGDDSAIHTAQDTMDRIDPAAVAAFLRSVDAALDALLPVPATP